MDEKDTEGGEKGVRPGGSRRTVQTLGSISLPMLTSLWIFPPPPQETR